MSQYVAVTVQVGQRQADLALPLHIPTRALIGGLMAIMGVAPHPGIRWSLGLKTPLGVVRPIPPNARLGDVEVRHGSVLVLLSEEFEPVLPTGAFLQAEDGTTFPLLGKETLIGRNDPQSGIFVDVDLSGVANEPKAISRRHARIEQEGDRFYLVDLGSRNGTKLNGRLLLPNERTPLWNEDVIEFGRRAARLTFFAGSARQEPRLKGDSLDT